MSEKDGRTMCFSCGACGASRRLHLMRFCLFSIFSWQEVGDIKLPGGQCPVSSSLVGRADSDSYWVHTLASPDNLWSISLWTVLAALERERTNNDYVRNNDSQPDSGEALEFIPSKYAIWKKYPGQLSKKSVFRCNSISCQWVGQWVSQWFIVSDLEICELVIIWSDKPTHFIDICI